MNSTLLFFTFLLVLSGIAFVTHNLWSTDKYLFSGMRKSTASMTVAYMVITLLFGAGGIYIAKHRTVHNCFVAAYATLIFFVIAIPLMAEGSAILELDRMDLDMIQKMCFMNLAHVSAKHNPITVSLVQNSKRFDIMSELILDGYMCTEQYCPCLNY